MHVLDIGCDVGDVSLLAVRLVGRIGRVTCIDIDDSALAIGRQRAQEQGFSKSPSGKPMLTCFAPHERSTP
jgi:ubiquinone/menaquinone biosynthesis C-methylase UbiE